MSTPKDRLELKRCLAKLPEPATVLYVGIHERRGLEDVRALWPRANMMTLDQDDLLRPDIRLDLNQSFDLARTAVYSSRRGDKTINGWDVGIVSCVLMYLDDPVGIALPGLLRACRTLVVQEPVVRNRPNKDPWPDKNRFICDAIPSYFVDNQRLRGLSKVEQEGGKRLIDLTGFRAETVRYYADPPGVAAIWHIKGSS